MKTQALKKVLITFFFILSCGVNASIAYDVYNSLDKEEKILYKDASREIWKSVWRTIDDCDYSTFLIKVQCINRHLLSGYCSTSKLIRNLKNEVLGTVGCGYNNTDRIYDLYYNINSKSVQIKKQNQTSFYEKQVCWECTSDGEVCWVIPFE